MGIWHQTINTGGTVKHSETKERSLSVAKSFFKKSLEAPRKQVSKMADWSPGGDTRMQTVIGREKFGWAGR